MAIETNGKHETKSKTPIKVLLLLPLSKCLDKIQCGVIR